MTYEVHITIDAKDEHLMNLHLGDFPAARAKVHRFSNFVGWEKPGIIVGGKQPTKKKVVMISFLLGDTFEASKKRAFECASFLAQHGVMAKRVKIETEADRDSQLHYKEDIRIYTPSGERQPRYSGMYYETHIPLLGTTNMVDGVAISINEKKFNKWGTIRSFPLKLRDSAANTLMALSNIQTVTFKDHMDKVHAKVGALAADKLQVSGEIQNELVLFDNGIEQDAGWCDTK